MFDKECETCRSLMGGMSHLSRYMNCYVHGPVETPNKPQGLTVTEVLQELHGSVKQHSQD